jgi:hypothetical protein
MGQPDSRRQSRHPRPDDDGIIMTHKNLKKVSRGLGVEGSSGISVLQANNSGKTVHLNPGFTPWASGTLYYLSFGPR